MSKKAGDREFAYQSLNVALKEIRLARILRVMGHADVFIELFPVSLYSLPKYYAVSTSLPSFSSQGLSGDETTKNLGYRIWINGFAALFTRNTHELLLALKSASIYTVRINTLCVNDLDPTEKTQQIRLIDDIFRNASTTMLWLGFVQQDDDPLLDFCPECQCKTPHARCPHVRVPRSTSGLGSISAAQPYVMDGRLYFDPNKITRSLPRCFQCGRYRLSLACSHHGRGDANEQADQLCAFAQLFELPWSRRIWALHEVFMSCRVELVWAERTWYEKGDEKPIPLPATYLKRLPWKYLERITDKLQQTIDGNRGFDDSENTLIVKGLAVIEKAKCCYEVIRSLERVLKDFGFR
jgi:Heterokaryon incompatibility protein (HET)